MERQSVVHLTPAANLNYILLSLAFFLLLMNVSSYGCSWYGRKPIDIPDPNSRQNEDYLTGKKPWNIAVFYLLGGSILATLIQMTVVICQTYGMHKTLHTGTKRESIL